MRNHDKNILKAKIVITIFVLSIIPLLIHIILKPYLFKTTAEMEHFFSLVWVASSGLWLYSIFICFFWRCGHCNQFPGFEWRRAHCKACLKELN